VITYAGRGACWGFARVPNADSDSIDASGWMEDQPVDHRWLRRISRDWFTLFDAYWAIKDGWS
jgi:hypothetical protein